MKKRILTAVFIAMLIALMAITASASKSTAFQATGDSYGFSFAITDSGVQIQGCVQNEDIYFLFVKMNGQYIVNIAPDVKFDTVIEFPEVDKCDIGIYLGTKMDEPFVGLFHSGDITLEKIDEKWYFTVDSDVYENNQKWMSGWLDPTLYLDKKQPDAVKMVTASVIKGIEGNYAKAEAIHKWVADNIYYDKDYAFNTKTATALTPVEVLTERISVCEGYSNLTVAMLNSAGIPAFKVSGYSLGVDAPKEWSSVSENAEANHAWVEAYIDGKWVVMDPTWDSKNMYNKGKKETLLPVAYRYFDISPFALSAKHKITYRPNLFGKEGISDWAEKEVFPAYSMGLMTEEIMTTMKDKITRREFCNLVVNLVTIKLGKGTNELLEEKELVLNFDFFKDTSEYNILVANALGIVNGKENNMFDPNGYITRQEAAVMLQRTAKVLGATAPNSTPVSFADAKIFPSWSADAISFVSASQTPDGYKVMGGIENNKFDPKGFYTKEQSVLTVYRLFNAY